MLATRRHRLEAHISAKYISLMLHIKSIYRLWLGKHQILRIGVKVNAGVYSCREGLMDLGLSQNK